MFDQIKYAAYTSTTFALNGDTLSVRAPWLDLEVAIDDEHRSDVHRAVERIAAGARAGAESGFLSFFAEHPLLHVLPRNVAGTFALYDAHPDNVVLYSDNPRDFMQFIARRLSIDANELPLSEQYEWNLQAALDDSKIANAEAYDPFAAYTHIRERRLLHQASRAAEANEFLRRLLEIRRDDEAEFFRIMANVLAQQYYVTRDCQDCLTPALEHLPAIRAQVIKYIAEEQHHDELILRSIRELTDKPASEFFFTKEIAIETEIIKYAAHVCPLAFACLVSVMEGTAYPERDQVSTLLAESSKPQSAKGVEAHFHINRDNNHTAIPETFVAALPPISATVVKSALRMTEVAIKMDAALSSRMQVEFIDNRR
jgi:hypothetical protein